MPQKSLKLTPPEEKVEVKAADAALDEMRLRMHNEIYGPQAVTDQIKQWMEEHRENSENIQDKIDKNVEVFKDLMRFQREMLE